MTWGAVAVGVGTVGAGIISSRASASAADTAAAGAAASGAQIKAAGDRARTDVLNFFPAAQQDLLAGAGAAGGLLAGGIGEQQRLLSAGNVGAQGTLQGGFGQVQNALLGLPVDQQAFAPKPIELSQIPQNPLAQNIQQNPAARQALAGQPTQQQQAAFDNLTPQQQADFSSLTPDQLRFISGVKPQQSSPLFGSLTQQAEERQSSALSGITSNIDLFNAVGSGELDLPGVDADFWRAITDGSRGGRTKWGKKGNMFFGSSSIAEAVTPAQQQAIVDNSGFKREERQKLAMIMREFQKLRGNA